PPAGTGGTDGRRDSPGRQAPENPHDGPCDGGPDDDGPSDSGSGSPGPDATRTPPAAGVLPAGFVGCINLTATLPALLGLAERPGELSGLGPADPALARGPA